MSKSQIESLNDFARVRLSKHFFMRDFLFSETASVLGLNNLPNNKELAIEAGKVYVKTCLSLSKTYGGVFMCVLRFEAKRLIKQVMRLVQVAQQTTGITVGIFVMLRALR